MRKLKHPKPGRRSAAVLIGAIAALAMALAAPAGAKTSHCLIINNALNATYTSLQAAQDAASAADTLWVRGNCVGTTEITKDLTITGQQPSGYTTPTLDGASQGSVLSIDSGVMVTINTLTITGGSGTNTEGVTGGGGINNFEGAVILNGTSITGNRADSGGGIANTGGSVTLNDSSISGNTASYGGGINSGINGTFVGSVTLNGSSSISDNTVGGGVPGDGGGIGSNGGTVTLNDSSSISGNTAVTEGGGVSVIAAASVTLNDSSSISGNTAGTLGGGIYNVGNSSVTLNDSSSITGNTAGADGGGIYNDVFAGPVTLNDSSSITGNTPNNCAPPGSVVGCTG